MTNRFSNMHIQRRFALRIGIFATILFIVWSFLLIRAFWIQIIWGPELVKRSANQYFVENKIQGYRGKILDRNGLVLAQSVKTYSVFVHPYAVGRKSFVARKLANILGQSYWIILKKLKSRKNFVWIKRKISDVKAKKIETLHLKGVYLTSEFARVYPHGHLLGQVIGFTNIDGKGLEGLEKSFDNYLKGKVKDTLVFKDAKRRLVRFNFVDANLNGQDVVLTIDAKLQAVVEDILEKTVRKFNAKAGQFIIAEAQTGEILALANYPFFNPNIFFKSSAFKRRNRAALDLFEPGSTAKTFLIASALEHKKCRPNTIYYCEQGKWKINRIFIRDTHEYGWLPVNKILRYSSNIGVGKIALDLGTENYYHTLSLLGFTKKVCLPLPGREQSLIRPPNLWTKIDLVSSGFGQGWATTGLHLVQAYLSLANKGMFTPLRLVLTPKLDKPISYQVFSQKVVKQVLKMLWEVVNQDGTGKNLRLKEVELGGKTGTAQKPDLVHGGYKKGAYISSFMGLVPASNPKYVLFMLIDEPQNAYYGSVVAGPGVRDMVLRLGAEDHSIFVVSNKKNRVSKLKRPVNKKSCSFRNIQNLPDLRGKPVRYALDILIPRGVVPSLKGKGLFVKNQIPQPGVPLKQGMKVSLILTYNVKELK
ncbi:penicillin-binding transpeptidase domain-containing protein [Desulfonauticus submarinus]